MKNLSMSMKIYLLLGLMALVAVIVFAIGLNKLSGMNDQIQKLVDVSAEKAILGARINQDLLSVSRAEKNMILAKTQTEMDDSAQHIDTAQTEMDKRREKLRTLADADDRSKLDQFGTIWDQYLRVHAQVRDLTRLNSNSKAKDLSQGKGREAFERFEKELGLIAAANEKDFERAKSAQDPALLAQAGEKIWLIARLLQNAIEFQRAEKNLILAEKQQTMEDYDAVLSDIEKQIDERFAALESLVDESGKSNLDKAQNTFAEFTRINNEVRSLMRENGNVWAFELASGKGRDLADKAETTITELVASINQDMLRDKQISDQNYANARWMMIVVSLAGIILASILAFFILSGINRKLQQVIAGINGGAEQVAAASTQVSTSSQSQAEGASEQASSLEETSSSLEEMAAQTRQNADNAEQADNAVKETANVVESGVSSMEKMNAAINEIKESANETSKIIKTIDDIAFQTNLLALNAAVEAARAGEAGKGFAVVAEEVRNLAQRSAEAAQNTAQLIEKSQENAGNGVHVAEEVTRQLESINGSSKKVNTLIAEIAAASKEQAQGIEQVNTAVSEMDKVVQQSAADSEESASASEELSAQAQQMREMVTELVNVVSGRALNNGRQRSMLSNADNGNKHQNRKTLKPHAAKADSAALKQMTVEPKKKSPSESVIPLDDSDFQDF